MKSIIVLLSGGLDSAVLLWLAKKEYEKVLALSFDYGQKHKVELKYAKELASIAGVEHLVVEVPSLRGIKTSSLLEGGPEVPSEEYKEGIPPATTVPMRNLIFLAIAGAYADAYEIDTIGIAVHSLDSPYPDCRPEFISSAESALTCGSMLSYKKKQRLKVYAPFLGMTKRDIALLGKSLGVPFEKTYSCYRGTEPPCGECATCRQREEALKDLLL
ncbi:7-cyano-7-deazaguanine synthase QueC [Thermocrinis sp.]